MSTERRTTWIVQAAPGDSSEKIRSATLMAIAVAKERYRGEFGEEETEVVILPDTAGCGPSGYLQNGILYHKLRGKQT